MTLEQKLMAGWELFRGEVDRMQSAVRMEDPNLSEEEVVATARARMVAARREEEKRERYHSV